MTTENQNRRIEDRLPSTRLQWGDASDFVEMRAGVSELKFEIERAESIGLTMLALPMKIAKAACGYINHLAERLGAVEAGAAPASAEPAQVPSELTSSLRRTLANCGPAATIDPLRTSIIAVCDTLDRLAAPSVPSGAGIDTRRFAEMLMNWHLAEDGYPSANAYQAIIAHIDAHCAQVAQAKAEEIHGYYAKAAREILRSEAAGTEKGEGA